MPLRLEGYLDNGRGEPLADIPAVATILGTSTVVDTTMTDDDGHWSFAGLPTADEYLVTLSDTSGNSVSRAPWSGEMRELFVRDYLEVAGKPVLIDEAAGNALAWSSTGLYAPTGITLAAADLRYEPIDTMYTKAESDARYPQKTDIDPYPNYLTSTEADALFLTPAEGNAAYATSAHNHDTTYVQLTGGSVMTGLLGPSTHNTRDLGTTGTRWRALYGMTGDLTTSLTVATKPVAISPDASNIVEWRSNGFYAAAGAVTDIWVNTLGDTMTGDLNMTANVLPTVTNVRSLGSTSLRWLKVWAQDADFTNAPTVGGAALLTSTTADALFLTPTEGNAAYVGLAGGSVMTGLLGPTTTNTRDLGTTTLRWRKLWGVDTDLSGTLIAAGTVGIGTITSPSALLHTGANASYSGAILDYASSLDPYTLDLRFRRARNTLTSPQIVASGDHLGSVQFWGYDGGAYRPAATIVAEVGATPGASDMPGALIFNTTADGAATPTERLRIAANGIISINSRPVIMAGVRVYHSANQTITTGTDTALAFNSERFDSDAFHDTVTNNSRLTVPAGHAGKYLIWATILWNAVADSTYRQVSLRVNGTRVIGMTGGPGMNSAGFGTAQSVSVVADLAVGDYVQTVAYHERGSNLDVLVAAEFTPEFGIQRVG